MKWLISTAFLLGLLGVYNFPFSTFGTSPDQIAKQGFETSKQYNKEKSVFQNRRVELVAAMKEKRMGNLFNITKDWLSDGIDRTPGRTLPEIKPDLVEFLKASSELKIIWFGHSTFLLNLDGRVILVDPIFSESAGPKIFMVKRFQKPVLKLEELPPIDYILISHDHHDHLDEASIKFFLNKKAKFITPLGVGSHLVGWGIAKERIEQRDWWQAVEFDDIKFVATPAQHFSGRDGFFDNETLWASWVVQSKNHKIYFSGDSGFDNHFKEIGKKYGPFDVAFIESGQYHKDWKAIHMLPEESIQAFIDLGAKKYFPVHWGMFQLSLHKWYDPIERVSNLSKKSNIDLLTPKLGELVNVNDSFNSQQWWKIIKELVH